MIKIVRTISGFDVIVDEKLFGRIDKDCKLRVNLLVEENTKIDYKDLRKIANELEKLKNYGLPELRACVCFREHETGAVVRGYLTDIRSAERCLEARKNEQYKLVMRGGKGTAIHWIENEELEESKFQTNIP